VGDLFGGRFEITLEKTDKQQGNHKEPNEQGDQDISYNALSSGSRHLFPQRLGRIGNRAGGEFFGQPLRDSSKFGHFLCYDHFWNLSIKYSWINIL